MDPRTVPPPLDRLPLFKRCECEGYCESWWGCSYCSRELRPKMTPSQHGMAGADDSAKHMKDAAPAFVLTALGDALLAFAGKEFTSDDIRKAAGPTVEAWLTAEPERRNCFPGWWRARVRLHRLQRVVGKDAITRRGSRRGAHATVWRFPTPEGTSNG